jgi:hypothetical protein
MKEHIARIYYSWWGNANINNRMWCILDPEGELYDYGSRKHCVKEAKLQGWKYQVERHHKKERGKMTILEKNF